MPNVRTISRAIVALLLATAFLMMSVASGVHELSHLGRHRHAAGTLAATDDAAIARIAPSDATDAAYAGGDFCFFCLHGSGIAHTVASFHIAPEQSRMPERVPPVVPDLAARSASLPSLRAPPFTA